MVGHYLMLYLLGVGLSGALFIWWIKKRILRVEVKRKKSVKKIERFEPMETSTPVDSHEENTRETAVDSIETRFSIIRKLSFSSIVILWFIALIFPFLKDIPATFVSITVAASGIILGIAARPFIENLISGIVISFSQPVKIGDTVIIDDQYGSVEDISITHTVVKIWNWRRYIIPNSRMLSKEFVNCTKGDTYQWIHVEFTVSYDSDIDAIKALAIGVASESRFFADYEQPKFWVMDLNERGYKCWVAAWADTPIDAWELGNDIRTELIRQFKDKGIKTHQFTIEANPKHTIGSKVGQTE